MNAEAARQLLENPLFIEAFNNVREGVILQIEESNIIDKDYRNELGLQLSALAGVKLAIEDYINTQRLDDDEENNVLSS